MIHMNLMILNYCLVDEIGLGGALLRGGLSIKF